MTLKDCERHAHRDLNAEVCEPWEQSGHDLAAGPASAQRKALRCDLLFWR
jgi:hypothetical protein